MNVRGKLPSNSLNLMDVEFRKHVVILNNFKPRILESEEKSFWPNEQNFTDQVVLFSQFQNTQELNFEANSPI